MLYGRIEEDGSITERQTGGAIDADDIKKGEDGLPVLRPIEIDATAPAPWQVLRGWEYEVLDNEIMRRNVFEDRVEDYRSASLIDIDTNAELARQKYITPGAGQAMTYQEKAAEAKDYLAAAAPNPDDYPLLGSEVGITAQSIGAVALIVNGKHLDFKQIGAAIERARLLAKASIADAADGAAIAAILDQVVWP